MAIKVGINGLGGLAATSCGRDAPRDDIDIVAVNDLTTRPRWPISSSYDSILGNLQADIAAKGDRITVDGDEFQVLAQKIRRAALEGSGRRPVFEATGRFTNATTRQAPAGGREAGHDHRAGQGT